MDIIWTDEFAHNGWVVPLDDLWPTGKRKGYLSTPIDGAKYQGQLWAAPFHTDVGLLYYHTDPFSTPPTTWSELVRMVQQVGNKFAHGYIWQGKHYEGLVCNFVELLSGYGGNILDPHDSKRVVVNNSEARQALSEMKSWIGTISPSDITLYDEDRSNAVWNSGDAMFMRNWPTSIALGNDASHPKTAQKFGVTSLPGGIPGINARSCLGGWGLGINAFSKKRDAAWEFIQWMLQEDAQRFAAIDASLTVTLESVYSDPYVLAQNPLYGRLPSIIKQAQLRPQSPHYPAITQAIQDAVYSALTGRSSIETTLAGLQSKLQGLI
jgi:multiple sugar transport system substrate-binding protein